MLEVKKVIEGNTRSIVGEMETDAPLEAVWAAISKPDELANWFPLRARVEGKVGGEIEYDWKPLFSFDWVDQITVWEPNKRLTYEPRPEEKSGIPYVVDFQLEASGGKTKVRMVHSGISTDSRWDGEFNSFFGGWSYELMSLQFYLDNHLGRKRTLIWAKAETNDGEEKQAVLRIAGRDGLFDNSSIERMKPADDYRFLLAGDEILEGAVLRAKPQEQDEFAGTIRNLNNGLLRIGTGTGYMFLWLALYGIPEQRVKRLQETLNKRFAELFKKSETGVA